MSDESKKRKLQPWSVGANAPEGATPIESYKGFQDVIHRWASGLLDSSLLVLGSAGIGKSETALQALKNVPGGYGYLKGKATSKGVYNTLFNHVDMPIVLDDTDDLLADVGVTALLKPLLETRKTKLVQWTSNATMSDSSNVPASFETTSRTLILANELKLVSKNFGAVQDRCLLFWFCPSAEEVHKYVGGWFPKADREVYEWVGERIGFAPSPSCRYYVKARQLKSAGLDWREMIGQGLKATPEDAKAMLVKKLLSEYGNDTDRIAAWKAETRESEGSYRAWKKVVNLAVGKVPERSKAISEAMKKKHAERRAAAAEAAAKPKAKAKK